MKKNLILLFSAMLFISACAAQATAPRLMEGRNSQLDPLQQNEITVKNGTNGDIAFIIHYGTIANPSVDDYNSVIKSGETATISINHECIMVTSYGKFRLKASQSYELFLNTAGKMKLKNITGD